MAENWAERLGGSIADRARNFGSNVSNSVRHPGQTAIRIAGRALGGLLGPLGSAVGGRLADSAVNRHVVSQLGDQSLGMIGNASNALDSQIWGSAPQMGANPISYGEMSGITSPQRGSYPSAQGPQQSPLASMLGLNNYQGNSQGQGLPGITSPNPYSSGATEQSFAPSYAPSDPNEHASQMRPDGSTLSAMSGSMSGSGLSGVGARDNFAGGGRSSAGGGSSDWGNTFASLGMLGSQGGGLDPQRNRYVGEHRLKKSLHDDLKKDPNNQKAQEWLARLRENATAGR